MNKQPTATRVELVMNIPYGEKQVIPKGTIFGALEYTYSRHRKGVWDVWVEYKGGRLKVLSREYKTLDDAKEPKK